MIDPNDVYPVLAKLLANSERTESNCLVWKGARLTKMGKWSYGRTTYHYRSFLVHRLAWEIFFGPIPPRTTVRHSCDNRPCWEPTHLLLGTDVDNKRDWLDRRR